MNLAVAEIERVWRDTAAQRLTQLVFCDLSIPTGGKGFSAYEDMRDKLITEQRFQPSRGGIVVEDDVWIGAGCVLLDGAILRRGCVIGAMSLVRGEVAAYSVQSGNPLREMGHRR